MNKQTLNFIFQWNCRGLVHKWHELRHTLSTTKPLIICLQETLLLPTDQYRFLSQHYRAHHHHAHPTRRQGGTSILISNTIPHHPIPLIGNLQAVACQITFQNTSFIVCSIYLPPSQPLDCNLLDQFLHQFTLPVIICGDFNGKHPLWGSINSDHRGRQIAHLINQHNLHTLNDGTPTRLNEHTGTSTHLDLTVCTPTLTPLLTWNCLEDFHGSDHAPILIQFTNKSTHTTHLHRWNTKRADWTEYNKHIKFNCSISDYKTKIPHITESLLTAAYRTIPHTPIGTRNHHNCPWWNEQCNQAIKHRKRALRHFRQQRTPETLDQYKRAKARARRTIRAAKRESWKTLTSSFTHRTPLQKLWQIVRSFRNTVSNTISLPVTKINNIIITNQLIVLNQLGEFYKNLSKNNSLNTGTTHNQTQSACNHSYNKQFTIHELSRALSHPRHTSPGPDSLHYSFFSQLSSENRTYVLEAINNIWTNNYFPPEWKHSHIIPILKPGKSATICSSYRPIQLTSCFCKIMERMILPRLQHFIHDKALISNRQTAFQKRRGTTDSINLLTTDIHTGFTKNHLTIAVFLDLKSAFNQISTPALLSHLTSRGLHGHLYHFIQEYLTDRTFQVRTTHLSSKFKQENGVVQGGVLSPTLFNIAVEQVTKNLPQNINHTTYADDITIWSTGSDFSTVIQHIQHALDIIQKQCTTLGFTISTTKSSSMIFQKRTSPHQQTQLKVNNTFIPWVKTQKYLGILLDSRLSLRHHIEHTKKRASQRICILKCLSHPTYGTDKTILINIYNTMVRPIIEYCSPLFCFNSPNILSKLDTIQNICLRIASGALRTSPITRLNAELKTTTLETRRIKQTIKYYLKISEDPQHPCFEKLNTLTSLDIISIKDINRFCGFTADMSFRRACTRIKFEPPTLTARPPENNYLNTPISITYLNTLQKHLTLPSLTQQLFFEQKAGLTEYTFIYTDGSQTSTGTSCAYTIPSHHLVKSYRLNKLCSIYVAEQYAIYQALNQIQRRKIKKSCIVTDSKSALNSLENGKNCLSLLTIQLHQELTENHYEIKYIWIPSHHGILGNEQADRAAKEAFHQISSSHSITPPLSATDLYPNLNKAISSEHPIHNTHHKYKTQPAHTYNKLPRRKLDTILTRLRIGHSKITHNYIIEGETPPVCHTCNQNLTIKHIILNCKKYHTNRTLYLSDIINQQNQTDCLEYLLYNPKALPYLFKFISSCSLLNCF